MRLFAALVLLAAPAEARRSSRSDHGKVCRKGKPCGNTCIAKSKTCHVGHGTAQ